MSRAVHVLVVDDNHAFRRGVLHALGGSSSIEAFGAIDLEDALGHVSQQAPDVILLDAHLPDGEGAPAVRALRSATPDSAICSLGVFEQDLEMLEALRAGARGCMKKDLDGARLARCVEALADGEVVITSAAADYIASCFLVVDLTAAPAHADRLTPREQQVLNLMSGGSDQKKVAALLSVEERIVGQHLRDAFAKLRSFDQRDDDGLLGSGVPRRPPPGGLWASAAATLEWEQPS